MGLEVGLPKQSEEEKAKEAAEAAVWASEALSGAADSLQLFLADVGRHKLLNAAQEVQLAKRIERGDPTAKRHMIESTLRLAVAIAKGYRGLGEPFIDPIQQWTHGLHSDGVQSAW